MSETTTCTRCGVECLDYRMRGEERLCIGCVWDNGYRAGLEAAAGKADSEHDALEETARGRSGWFRTIMEERALVCVQLADEIRALKGGE